MILVGVYMSLVGALCMVVATAVSYTPLQDHIKEVVKIISYPPLVFGYSCFSANIIQFATDQMIEIGASGEELSALIHWQYWAMSLGHFLKSILQNMNVVDSEQSNITLILSLVCLSALILSHLCFKKWLITTPLIANTLKNMYSILNYARKTKYPPKRSALTYFDEEHPSRIDHGKDKFGGPFTEEEVEDVKTVLRLIPLFVCALAYGISINHWYFFKSHLQTTHDIFFNDIPLYCTMTILVPPIYQLILYPLFYNSIPTMLQRTGIGLLLVIFSTISYLAIDTIGHLMDTNVECMFGNHSKLQLSSEWLCIPLILNGIGVCILEMSFLEFLIAQTPAKMKGLIIGLWYVVRGVGSSLGILLPFIFEYLPHIYPSCGFYYFLTKLVLLISVFAIFLRAAIWYKLRQREIVVNVHAIAEEHWERYMDQRDEYEKLWGPDDNNIYA